MELLGKGTYGKVYVSDDDPGKAVKIIKRDEASKFESEEYLLSISNDHIAKVFQVETRLNQIYIYMARYDSDLQKLISSTHSTLPLRDIMRLEYQIGSALQYLHLNKRILHADVKPDNILLDRKLNFFLCDFSLSMDLNQDILTATNQVYSAFYRPPILYYNTQIKNGHKIRQEYDFYALFMVLCFAYAHFILVDDHSNVEDKVQESFFC